MRSDIHGRTRRGRGELGASARGRQGLLEQGGLTYPHPIRFDLDAIRFDSIGYPFVDHIQKNNVSKIQ